MQVFKAFLKVAFSKKIVILLYTVIFLAIAVIFTVVQSSSTNDFTSRKLSVYVIDNDDTDESRELIAYLERLYGKENIKTADFDRDRILQNLYYQDVNYAVSIEKGYSEKLAKGDTKELFVSYTIPGSFYQSLGDSVLNKYIQCASGFIMSGMDTKTAVKSAGDILSDEVKVSVYSEEKTESEDLSVPKMYFEYLSYILFSVVVSALVPALIVFNDKEIKARTNVSCVTPSKQLTQKLMGTLVFAVLIWLVFMIAGFALFGSKIVNVKGVYAIIESLVFMGTGVSMAMLISTLIKSAKVSDMIAITVGLGMSFICGVFVPQSMLGDGVVTAAHVLPAYWYVRVLDHVFAEGSVDASEIIICTIAQLIFMAAMFVVILFVSKKKRRSA